MRSSHEAQRQLTGFSNAPVLLGQPMEDILFHEAIAGHAADLIEHPNANTAEPDGIEVWEKAAEDCVLARVTGMRIFGGLPRHKAPLTRQERVKRYQTLLRLWANGCTSVVDEDLFADILNRHENLSNS
ncbi:MAG: hypothetical protein ABJJ37_11170 [Roseibium sp.]